MPHLTRSRLREGCDAMDLGSVGKLPCVKRVRPNPMPASQAGRSVSGRWSDGCRRAAGRAAARAGAEEIGDHRKPGGSHGQCRDHGRHCSGAGRLHAADQRDRDRYLSGELRQARIRSDQGPDPDRRHRRDADAADHRQRQPAERHQGPDRMGQEQARRSHIQHRRLRPVAASCRRGNGPAPADQGRARCLQGRCASLDRSDHRACRFRQFRRRLGAAAGQ